MMRPSDDLIHCSWRCKEAALAINILLGNCIQDLTPVLVEELRGLPSNSDANTIIQRSFERYRARKLLGLRFRQAGLLGISSGLSLLQGLILIAGTLSYISLIIGSHSVQSTPLFLSGIGAACLTLLLSIAAGIHLCKFHSKLFHSIKNLGFERAQWKNTCLSAEDFALIADACQSEKSTD